MINIYYYEFGSFGNAKLVCRVKRKSDILPRIQKYVKKNWDEEYNLKGYSAKARSVTLHLRNIKRPLGEFDW